ncbi:hypothetical protein RHSIM_RhsimUnG0116600 [Rhododendron simsii]|uniref:SWIM-type domain-containing protein n=1 Tax=Rhododendron simsii TaxID=118357 RepID=A0A834FVE9_RHOSS|nr:hypothetical protein RHSIM_RhsimUnG0116600 [Rhododendron simsii]
MLHFEWQLEVLKEKERLLIPAKEKIIDDHQVHFADPSPENFAIKFNHDGNSVNYFDYCDNDRISRIELEAMSKELGATYMGRFRSLMEEFKEEDVAAFKLLAKHEPHHWSRSHFSEAPKCDMLLNNLCESFNAAVLDAIITMLERIRIYLVRRASIEKWNSQIVGGFHGNQFCIDMNAKTCSCRRWELTGIPCAHALAVIRESKKKVHGIVHDYYQKQTYINIQHLQACDVPHEWNGHVGENRQATNSSTTLH